jgi:glycosyltransferase involved in cell wall biosynthesis
MAHYWAKHDGVNILGDLGGDFGLAEAGRKMADLLLAQAIPVGYIHKEFNTLSTSLAPNYAELINRPTYSINLSNLNLRETKALFSRDQWVLFTGARYTIANWYWELPKLPSDSLDAIHWVDEIWVASRYVQEVFSHEAAAAGIPIHIMPPYIAVDVPEQPNRAKFGLPANRHIMLFTFSALSGYSRKNPLAIVEAYRRAFGKTAASDAPLLVFKVQFLERTPQFAAVLRQAAASIGALVLAQPLSRTDYNELLACADSYISLHRSEGFGLGMAEAMYLGKPVIATNYSSNTDFMTADNSYLVDYTLRAITPEDSKYFPALSRVYEAGQLWAEPDLDHAAALMTQVVMQPELAQARGQRAAASIREQYSVESLAKRVEQRLTQIDLTLPTVGHKYIDGLGRPTSSPATGHRVNRLFALAAPAAAEPSAALVLHQRLDQFNNARSRNPLRRLNINFEHLSLIGPLWLVLVRVFNLGRVQNAEFQLLKDLIKIVERQQDQLQLYSYKLSALEAELDAANSTDRIR